MILKCTKNKILPAMEFPSIRTSSIISKADRKPREWFVVAENKDAALKRLFSTHITFPSNVLLCAKCSFISHSA
jgi:hypothetical protein